MKKLAKKAAKAVSSRQEKSAKAQLMQELFNDLNRSRVSVYKMNFFRGIFFGLGSVIGGTVVLALLIWLMTILANFIPPLSDFFDSLTQLLESGEK